ncbi:unnamed protein product, partial [Symbiodinium sp. CCMP2456]
VVQERLYKVYWVWEEMTPWDKIRLQLDPQQPLLQCLPYLHLNLHPHYHLYLPNSFQVPQMITFWLRWLKASRRCCANSRVGVMTGRRLKPGITELPLLPEYQPSTGSIDLLHWLTHIAPIMEDLSDTSLAWWQETMKDALRWYSEYASASPLARLQLQPRPSTELRPEWARVERRATAMMLSAVPKTIREEIIANGRVSSLVVLCKLYAVYQPGNLQEKTLVLRMLEQPDECHTALQAVEGLRKWSLWRRRAATLGMAEPDASVLVRGLDRITGQIIKGSGELDFRVSLIRSTLQVDVSPSSATVTTFLQHLQAEMEQQARLNNNPKDEVKECRSPGGGQATPKSGEGDEGFAGGPEVGGPKAHPERHQSMDNYDLAYDNPKVIVPLGKVISTLGYRLHSTQDVCELLSDEGEVLPLSVVKGCPELPQETAAALISQLEAKQLPELRQTTSTTVKAITEVKQSWWSHLMSYIQNGGTECGRRAVDKADFLDYKDVIKNDMVIRLPRPGIWELMKALTLNRRARKRLLRASSWMVRWDPPSVDRSRDELRHLAYVGDSVYLNMNTLLVENEFVDVWKVVWWAAVQGRVSTVVARDTTLRPMDQLSVAPHRGKVHWLHALSSAGRAIRGGEPVRLYVENPNALSTMMTNFMDEELSEEDVDPEEAQVEEETPDFSGDDLRKERECWERLKATFKEPLKTETVYFCVPIAGKKVIYTLPALQMVTEIKALEYPVARVHSDRGGEFRGNLVKRWLAAQGILRTTSTGSEPAENGVAEAGVRYLKRRARTLLDAARLPRVHWPTAVQTAAVQQRCWKLGIPDPTVVAYGAKVYVKVKK